LIVLSWKDWILQTIWIKVYLGKLMQLSDKWKLKYAFSEFIFPICCRTNLFFAIWFADWSSISVDRWALVCVRHFYEETICKFAKTENKMMKMIVFAKVKIALITVLYIFHHWWFCLSWVTLFERCNFKFDKNEFESSLWTKSLH